MVPRRSTDRLVDGHLREARETTGLHHEHARPGVTADDGCVFRPNRSPVPDLPDHLRPLLAPHIPSPRRGPGKAAPTNRGADLRGPSIQASRSVRVIDPSGIGDRLIPESVIGLVRSTQQLSQLAHGQPLCRHRVLLFGERPEAAARPAPSTLHCVARPGAYLQGTFHLPWNRCSTWPEWAFHLPRNRCSTWSGARNE